MSTTVDLSTTTCCDEGVSDCPVSFSSCDSDSSSLSDSPLDVLDSSLVEDDDDSWGSMVTVATGTSWGAFAMQQSDCHAHTMQAEWGCWAKTSCVYYNTILLHKILTAQLIDHNQ